MQQNSLVFDSQMLTGPDGFVTGKSRSYGAVALRCHLFLGLKDGTYGPMKWLLMYEQLQACAAIQQQSTKTNFGMQQFGTTSCIISNVQASMCFQADGK